MALRNSCVRDSIMSRVSLLVVSLASATSSAEQLYMCSLLPGPISAASPLLGVVELVGKEVSVSIGNLSQVGETRNHAAAICMQHEHVHVT